MRILWMAFLLPTLLLFRPAPPESKVTWNITEYDFGQVEYGTPVYCTFVMTNVSNEPVIIDNVRTSCGCTAPFWTEKEVMPGDTSHVVMEYDAHDKGDFYRWVRVFISGQRRPERLYVQGSVKKVEEEE